jgi:hypothetical protein
MRELALRSLRHGAALRRAGDEAAAAVLAEEIAIRRWSCRVLALRS